MRGKRWGSGPALQSPWGRKGPGSLRLQSGPSCVSPGPLPCVPGPCRPPGAGYSVGSLTAGPGHGCVRWGSQGPASGSSATRASHPVPAAPPATSLGITGGPGSPRLTRARGSQPGIPPTCSPVGGQQCRTSMDTHPPAVQGAQLPAFWGAALGEWELPQRGTLPPAEGGTVAKDDACRGNSRVPLLLGRVPRGAVPPWSFPKPPG